MRQLTKFCLVGGSSTVINVIIYKFLLTQLPDIPWYISSSIAFVVSVFNGFYWNRRWTFKSQQQGPLKKQLPKFFLTNLIGLFLNLIIQKGVLLMITGKLMHEKNPDPNQNIMAMLCAIPIVVIWNFSASRLWTFRTPKPKATAPVSHSVAAQD